MSVSGTVNILESELWPQRDARDPIGIFGWRVLQAGDATGGSNKIFIQVPEQIRHAYVMKISDMIIAQIVGSIVATVGKSRVLTNWPNIDVDPGIQTYGTSHFFTLTGDASFTAPRAGPFDAEALPRGLGDLLIYDPSTQTGDMVIAEQETVNTNNTTYSFEGYGYYWDRAVMSTPGGPRNPGTA